MTNRMSLRGRIVSAGVVAAVSAGLATGALAAGDAEPPTKKDPRIAVLATVGTPAPEVDRAITAAQAEAGGRSTHTTVVRAGGVLDAQAQAAALAAEGYVVIAGVGDAGRAAIGQADGADVRPGVHWVGVR
jgi:hypothetical protein